MALLRISGVGRQYDGDYQFDKPFNGREHNEVKRISNVLPADYGKAIEGLDAAFHVALAVVAIRRAGKPVHEDMLLDADECSIQIIVEQQEADAVPPARRPRAAKSSVKSDSGDSSGS